ncbi:MAG: dTDP-glucose 4,6-dehydratase [Parcubacteria group bacterium Gr01-1014_48]|nr:MAG: dTDP-glucose 4,6-dehydratase [Parcubacteria group bacterium Greene0416_14]TSC73640.1 MAG: dTDP-glucose 4,6-dehydratase [Parcubacteria group bacterium Gr01-1014_48]TSD00357.1 MAG: dTDP-glucose 4,6-dehydratase [Parcubacteria group bacterium Greene1014_15]
MQKSGKKVAVVTGGAGFVGSHLCERLLTDGFRVVCIDNFYTGKQEHIAHVLSNPDFESIEADVEYPVSLDGDVDYIYHLACPASPVAYQRDPVKTVRTNVLGMINMLEFARTKGARILQASTSEIYGDPLEHPQTENYRGHVNTLGPRACYDEGKRCAETLCMDYHRQYGVDVKIVRIFNTYGPRMAPNDGRVVSNFIVSALTGEDIVVYGDGTQTRSFQYIDDLINGLTSMMQKEDFVGPVNLGNPGEFTMNELAHRVLSLTGSKSKIVFRPLPEDDPKKRQPDISLAKEKLGWKPTIGLDDGLVKTIAYFKKTLEVR